MGSGPAGPIEGPAGSCSSITQVHSNGTGNDHQPAGGEHMTGSAAPALESRLRGNPRRRRSEGMVRAVLFAAAGLSILISVGIVLSLIFEAISFLSQIELSQLFAAGWFPRRGMFSIPTVLVGTLIVTAIAIALAAPIGLASAIYL